MSPKSLSFINYLKKISHINFATPSSGGKVGLNKTITGFNRSAGSDTLDQFSSVNFMLSSKDKRNQLHASDIKQFIIEEN